MLNPHPFILNVHLAAKQTTHSTFSFGCVTCKKKTNLNCKTVGDAVCDCILGAVAVPFSFWPFLNVRARKAFNHLQAYDLHHRCTAVSACVSIAFGSDPHFSRRLLLYQFLVCFFFCYSGMCVPVRCACVLLVFFRLSTLSLVFAVCFGIIYIAFAIYYPFHVSHFSSLNHFLFLRQMYHYLCNEFGLLFSSLGCCCLFLYYLLYAL